MNLSAIARRASPVAAAVQAPTLSAANSTILQRNSYLMARQALSVATQLGLEPAPTRATFALRKSHRLHQYQNGILFGAKVTPSSKADRTVVQSYLAKLQPQGLGFKGLEGLLKPSSTVLRVESSTPKVQQQGIVTLPLLNERGVMAAFVTGRRVNGRLEVMAHSPVVDKATAQAYVPSDFPR